MYTMYTLKIVKKQRVKTGYSYDANCNYSLPIVVTIIKIISTTKYGIACDSEPTLLFLSSR